ncbi:uncharacterized protein CC84DRAFT_1214372 [Paraphaeosphaeria sporulosa]|uniref:Uncharacterized protein n=1 Tax=Paraphaeosphaeria sporulosa TaxID=1460663 RepID=A0A177CUB4_9PLEO|nr:uncharacterized protein CC84DRAFT_1214372 [Paraphaeosphaeria sporulosa]OAG11124.1 hypothetical protein CC84DRAFT_1214372 [Paraphaeosphaeria sporulosa]
MTRASHDDVRLPESSPSRSDMHTGRPRQPDPLFTFQAGHVSLEDFPKLHRAPEAWLGEWFCRPESLRNTLIESGAAIVGSRFLDYLAPGFCGPDSDWNFAVDNNPVNVWRLITGLQHCGVLFQTRAERILACLAYPQAHVSFVATKLDIWQSMHVAMSRGSSTHTKKALLAVDYYIGEDQMCFAKSGELIQHQFKCEVAAVPTIDGSGYKTRVRVWRMFGFPKGEYDWRGQFVTNLPTTVINGSITTRHRSAKVQVIVTAGGYRNHILSSHLSCTQGYVSGEVAAVLYPELTARREFYAWKTLQDAERDRDARRKYERRGFSEVALPLHPDVRDHVLGDPSTMVVHFQAVAAHLSLPNDMWPATYVAEPTEFVWEQIADWLHVPASATPSTYRLLPLRYETMTTNHTAHLCMRYGVPVPCPAHNEVTRDLRTQMLQEAKEFLIVRESVSFVRWAVRRTVVVDRVNEEDAWHLDRLFAMPAEEPVKPSQLPPRSVFDVPECRNRVYGYLIADDHAASRRFIAPRSTGSRGNSGLFSVSRMFRAEYGPLWMQLHAEQIEEQVRQVRRAIRRLEKQTNSKWDVKFQDTSAAHVRPEVIIQGALPGEMSLASLCRIRAVIPILGITFKACRPTCAPEPYELINVALGNSCPAWRACLKKRALVDLQFQLGGQGQVPCLKFFMEEGANVGLRMFHELGFPPLRPDFDVKVWTLHGGLR